MSERIRSLLRSVDATLFLFVLAGVAQTLNAQTVTFFKLTDSSCEVRAQTVYTYIGMSNPAQFTGTVTTATVRWTPGFDATCTDAFKVKIFRPPGLDAPTYPTVALVAERGPFDSHAGFITVPLTPPIDVEPGDVIGISQLKIGRCGGVAFAFAPQGATVLQVPGDFAGGSLSGELMQERLMVARAAATADVLEGVIAAGGAVAGSGGSFFRTSVQLSNLSNSSLIAGKIVFHPAGRSAAASDPSVRYSLAPKATTSFPDIVASMNTSGLGSLDLISTNGPPPSAVVRVFDDQGASGTKGFTEEVITPSAALQTGESIPIPIPTDLANFRVNVGVRTLGTGAEVTVSTFAPSGGSAVHQSPKKIYAPNYFEQVPLATFLDFTPQAGGMARIYVSSGHAIIYFSTTDNRTNDSSIKFALRQ